MRACITNAVGNVVVRQESRDLLHIESTLQQLHAREARIFKELSDLRCRIAEVFRNEVEIREMILQRVYESNTGTLDPAAAAGCCITVWDGEIALKSSEMIYADHIEQLSQSRYPADPPAKAVLFHHIPVVQRIAPELSVLSEQIRRYARDFLRQFLLIELEPVRFSPDFRGIQSYVYRDVPYYAYARFIRVSLEIIPLLIEQELNILKHFHVFEEFFVPSGAGFRLMESYVFIRPLCPRAHVIVLLERHEKRVVREPLFFHDESAERVPVPRDTPCGSFSQQSKSVLVQFAVVHLVRIVSEIGCISFLLCKKSVFDEDLKIHVIRISGKRRKALIRRISVTDRTYRQHLPVLLSRGT